MAHMIDETAGQAAIAYRGNEPRHGLGQYIEADDDIDTIVRKAGLSHQVVESPVMFKPYVQQADGTWLNDQTHLVPDRKVLYRSDTLKPLAVVSRDYNVVQPRAIVEFFDAMVKSGGSASKPPGAVWRQAGLGPLAHRRRRADRRPRLRAPVHARCHVVRRHDGHDREVRERARGLPQHHLGGTRRRRQADQGLPLGEFDPARVRQDMGVALDAFEEWVIRRGAWPAASCPMKKPPC